MGDGRNLLDPGPGFHAVCDVLVWEATPQKRCQLMSGEGGVFLKRF